MNTTVSTASTAYFNKTFYDRKLLDTAKTRFVHANFGQKRSIPRNNGKRVEFRKYNLFTPDTGALTLEMTSYDPVIADSAELLGEQLGTVIEWVTRDAMCETTNVQYAGGAASRVALTASDKLTVAEIRKAVRTLKKNKARPFVTAMDGSARKPHFICICSPDATYDLQNDALWQDVSKYSNAEQIYSGEIGRLFGVVFVEATEAKAYSQSIVNAVNASTSSSTTFVLKTMPDAKGVAFLSTPGNKIRIGSNEYTLASTNPYTPGTRTVKLTTSQSLTADAPVYSVDAGAPDATTHIAPDVHATLVFGADAYGVIDVAGSGAMETIIKPRGSAGTTDPLDQRSTVGAKVAAYTAKVLNPLWLVKIEHCVSQ